MPKYAKGLGEDIKLPGDDSQDKTLDTVLGIVRISCEQVWNFKYEKDLPWLANRDDEEANRFKEWEISAGALGDRLAGALGRTAAVAATSLLNPILKLPDEVTVGIAFAAGVQGRKLAELKMHQYLKEHPDTK